MNNLTIKQFNNQTNRVIKIDNVIRTNTSKQKIMGLLRTTKPYPLYLQTRFGIHTFGMKYPIDVIILDDKYIVRNMKQNLKPWKIFLWHPKWQHVLELPEGEIKRKQIYRGCKIYISK